MWRRLLRLAVGALTVAGAWAHGYMNVPISRNVGATDCKHCLNAGGPFAVGKWPDGAHGVCGDPAPGKQGNTQPGFHEGGGGFQQKVGYREVYYHAGDVMKVSIVITANHVGYFQYFLCKLDQNVKGAAERPFVTDRCFDKMPLKVLQDGWGPRYYVKASNKPFESQVFENSVQLPDMECPRCVLRWYYATGNSCVPPGTPDKWAKSEDGGPGPDPCKPNGDLVPEEFWNCADIVLLKKGEPLPATSTTKIKGELSTATVANHTSNDVEPGDQVIQNTDNEGDYTAATPSTGTTSATGTTPSTGLSPAGSSTTADTTSAGQLVSFPNVMISVAIGGGVAIPVVILSPIMGTAVGLLAFVAAMVFFMIRNHTEKYERYR